MWQYWKSSPLTNKKTPGSDSSRPLCPWTIRAGIRESELVVWGKYFNSDYLVTTSLARVCTGALGRGGGSPETAVGRTPLSRRPAVVQWTPLCVSPTFNSKELQWKNKKTFSSIRPTLWLSNFGQRWNSFGCIICWKHGFRILDARNMDMASSKFNCW